jgi:hypothetical protein
MLARYRQQILFPVLRLLLAVLVSFGRENQLAANQVSYRDLPVFFGPLT